jgi:hypothetical protein
MHLCDFAPALWWRSAHDLSTARHATRRRPQPEAPPPAPSETLALFLHLKVVEQGFGLNSIMVSAFAGSTTCGAKSI